ncbi:MAG TPA: SAF domain-containing protein [Candidatus Gracilibacteria bacterium]
MKKTFQAWRQKRRFKKQHTLPIITLPYDAHIQKLKRRYAITFLIMLLIGVWYSYAYHQQYVIDHQIIYAVIAEQDISSPKLIESEDLKLKGIPRKYLPRQFFLETESLTDQLLVQDLIEGEVLLPHHLKPKSDPNSISAKFENDYAFTLDEEWLIARLPQLKSKDHIDLIVSNPGNQEDLIIAENLEILAIQTNKAGKKTLVLNTTKAQSESIIAARSLRLAMQVLVRSSIGKISEPINHE